LQLHEIPGPPGPCIIWATPGQTLDLLVLQAAETCSQLSNRLWWETKSNPDPVGIEIALQMDVNCRLRNPRWEPSTFDFTSGPSRGQGAMVAVRLLGTKTTDFNQGDHSEKQVRCPADPAARIHWATSRAAIS